MKATPLQAIASSMLVKAFQAKGELFLPVLVKDAAHLKELKEQAARIVVELAKEYGEDTTKMESILDKEFGEPAQDEPASKADPKQSEPAKKEKVTFYGQPAEALISSFKEVRKKLSDISKGKPDNVREVRGVAKLGKENGMYAFIVFTDDESVFDTAEAGEYPGQEKCSNPNCKGCNPDAREMSDTIQ